jgi:endonuclease G, mitochondrial
MSDSLRLLRRVAALLLPLGVLLVGCPKPAAPPPPPTKTTQSQPDNQTKPASKPRTRASSATDAPLELLGNPDSASTDPSETERFLIQHPDLLISYNDNLRFPNWVAWHLDNNDIRSGDRGQFKPDDLPDGYTEITTRDYSNTGYDRGHNCPSKDREPRKVVGKDGNRTVTDDVFLMTNITPQKHGMNGGPWSGLEDYCRKLTEEGNELYIICGHGFDNMGKKPKRIGSKKIAVPDFGWKIVVVLPEKRGDDLARIDAETRVIAVLMPNRENISGQPWDSYLTTVADIEEVTGMTFFEPLPAALAKTLKQKRDEGVNSFAEGPSGFKKGKRR